MPALIPCILLAICRKIPVYYRVRQHLWLSATFFPVKADLCLCVMFACWLSKTLVLLPHIIKIKSNFQTSKMLCSKQHFMEQCSLPEASSTYCNHCISPSLFSGSLPKASSRSIDEADWLPWSHRESLKAFGLGKTMKA